tara:strand:- start:162 stop:548 length:387 start_codon:yes stop_codon:yes gene_type:complete
MGLLKIMRYKFNVGEYLTRSGEKAVVVSDKCPDDKYPLVGWVEHEKSGCGAVSWTREGVFNVLTDSDSDIDLMPPKKWSLGRLSLELDGQWVKAQWIKAHGTTVFCITQCDAKSAARIVDLLNKAEGV